MFYTFSVEFPISDYLAAITKLERGTATHDDFVSQHVERLARIGLNKAM